MKLNCSIEILNRFSRHECSFIVDSIIPPKAFKTNYVQFKCSFRKGSGDNVVP